MDSSGKKMIRVNGTTSPSITSSTVYKEEIYSFKTVYYKGNLSIGQKLQAMDNEGNIIEGEDIVLNGLTKSGSTWTIGAGEDVNTRTAVLKVDGNLTIQSGITLTTPYASYRGTKGLFIYATGEITNKGTISMDSREADGNNPFYLLKQMAGNFKYIQGGGAGAQSKLTVYTSGNGGTYANRPGGGRRSKWI